MGEKIIFRYHKMYNLRLYRQKSSYLLHQLKQTDVVKRHFIIFYLYK